MYPLSLKQTRWYRAKSDYGNTANRRAHVNQRLVFRATFPCNRSRYRDRQAGIFRRWPCANRSARSPSESIVFILSDISSSVGHILRIFVILVGHIYSCGHNWLCRTYLAGTGRRLFSVVSLRCRRWPLLSHVSRPLCRRSRCLYEQTPLSDTFGHHVSRDDCRPMWMLPERMDLLCIDDGQMTDSQVTTVRTHFSIQLINT